MNAHLFKVGQVVHAASASLEAKRTEPPAHYTEDTLLGDMLSAHKFATTEADRQMLKAISGIGTSRTRGVILSNFVKRGFLLRQKKGNRHELRISQDGRRLLQGLPPLLTDVALTAKWEKALEMVAKGQASAEQVRAKVEAVLKEQIPGVLLAPGSRVAPLGGTNREQ